MVSKTGLSQFRESDLQILADTASSSSKKSPFFFDKDLTFVRSLVCDILNEYVLRELSVSKPVKCIDVLGGTGISGLLWKKQLGDTVDVKINNINEEACEIIRQNALTNDLSVEVSNRDPCIVLHERGYNFIYLDCTNDATNYFDSAFRNISRNGILVVTAKDDCSLHGSNPDVAMRRYHGRITRTLYYQELGIRLVIASLARTAAKYNKAISVLLCVGYKNTFTIAVMSQKGPILANKSLENIRLVMHCMVCENRKFYPASDGFVQDVSAVKLDCGCDDDAPGNTRLELGPIWSGSIFNIPFIEGMLARNSSANLELRTTLELILEEARCPTKAAPSDSEPSTKRSKYDSEEEEPPFYFNVHKHHPQDVKQLTKLNRVVERLRAAGHRASRTHFDRLAVRTDAPVALLFKVMRDLGDAR